MLFADNTTDFLRLITSAFGADEAAYVTAEISKAWDKADEENCSDCTDNYRMAVMGDGEAEKAYFDAESNGCCGTWEVVFGPSPAGKTYLYGFNYGH